MKTRVLILPLLLVTVLRADEMDRVIADFEGTDYADWRMDGDAFGNKPAQGKLVGQQDVLGFRGNGLVNTFRDHDRSLGTLTSPEFVVDRDYLVFLIGGGMHPGKTGMELLVDGTSARTATGRNQEMLAWHTWDVRKLRGKRARLRIFDRTTAGFGHINVDQIIASNRSRKGPGVLRLADYRKTTDYYRETYRPQFHFSPPINWMNDPNGLVYHLGEYHLFYQHNPHGNSWGHMSWGHAVSDDLVHWKHLPIALHEEYGVMIFSGCCVVDWKNTSGFGVNGQPPMVAIYTGHGLGKQTQDIAYSTDRGRTWTKYANNPVIDLNEANFRDPKVFWHAPRQRWVMVVSMANDKYVQFYSSRDLKQWVHLSDFGPAGVEGKPNWECPDLFELPIEGRPGETRWVLEVDMGSHAVAGGSGGEYFVGDFDGQRFHCDDAKQASKWVDYGRDFYAPVSWSDVPAKDGRRIWIGWMNNWETSQLPTRPWRSAMSIPRSLSLRPTPQGLVLIQTPVKELEKLRQGDPIERLDWKLPMGVTSIPELRGPMWEIKAEFDVGTATEFGFELRSGDGEKTVVGYRVDEEELFVDRTDAGQDDFHPAFAGRHAGKLTSDQGRVRVHIFVDTSSVEVFGDDGAVVITDRIFPRPNSVETTVYSLGGRAQLRRLTAWSLQSAWH